MNETFTFFFRAESRTFNLATAKVYSASMEVPEGSTGAEGLKLARESRVVPGGSHRSGVFEIQTDKGIWSRTDEMRLDWSTPAKAAKAIFKTYEALEAEEIEAQRAHVLNNLENNS